MISYQIICKALDSICIIIFMQVRLIYMERLELKSINLETKYNFAFTKIRFLIFYLRL